MSRAAARELVLRCIKDNKVMVFSKSYCPYCSKAKAALKSLLDSAKITILEIENRSDVNEIQDELMDITGGRSVPRVFVDGQFIGGGDDTAAMAASGELRKLLTDKGIL